MGDWRRVQIMGTVEPKDVRALSEALSVNFIDDRWDCLCCGGACGLANWAQPEISTVGNLGERGFDEHSVAEHLAKLVEAAPSLRCRVHVGDHYEGDACVATVVLGDDGVPHVVEPEVEKVPPMDSALMQQNLLAQLMGQGVGFGRK